MQMVDVRNNVHRSGFDLSKRNCFTAKVGEILPVYQKPVLPGDKWKINLRHFMRTQPVQTATFGRVRLYYDFYFVPYSLLWDKFDAWAMQTKNAYHAKNVVSSADLASRHPYISLKDMLMAIETIATSSSKIYNDSYGLSTPTGGTAPTAADEFRYQTSKLLSYLGYPLNLSVGLSGADLALSPWPLLAYQKIYQDYFRFAQWEDAAPWTYNLDYINDSANSGIDFQSMATNATTSLPTMLSLRYASLDKDLLNGMLPSPQYGDTAIAGPLSGSPGQVFLDSSSLSSTLKTRFNARVNSSAPSSFTTLVRNASTRNAEQVGDASSDDVYLSNFRGTYAVETSSSDSSNPFDSMGLSILMLRQAEALQKWKEICISGNPDFREQLQKHWNVNISNDLSYRCQYLGGIASNVDVSEVINNNFSGSGDDFVADIKGKGVSASNGEITFDSHQYGIIMCVFHAKPIMEWNGSSLLSPWMTAVSQTDYPIPEFDSVGMQQLQLGNFVYNCVNNFTAPIGYVPRYADYKTDVDELHGAFDKLATLSLGGAGALEPWVIPHSLSNGTTPSSITYKTFKIPIGCVDNMFGSAADDSVATDQLLCAAYFDVKTVRNLDRNGLPY